MTSTAGPVTIRAAEPSDLQNVLRVRQAHELADTGSSDITAERLAAEWEALGSRLATQVWCAVSTDGRLLACADLLCEDHTFSPRLWAPAGHHDSELEVALLARTERRAYEIGRDEGAQSIQFFAQAASAHPAIQQALLQSGFVVTSTYEQMELALNEPPASPVASIGIEIRPFTVGEDAEVIYRADEEAFQDQRGYTPRSFEQWKARLNLSGETVDPSLWLIAWDVDEVAGAALGEVINGVGWIHHLGVRRSWRHRGLGEALTRSALGAFFRNGVSVVRLNVDADSLTNAHQLYRRVGFRPMRDYSNYQKITALA